MVPAVKIHFVAHIFTLHLSAIMIPLFFVSKYSLQILQWKKLQIQSRRLLWIKTETKFTELSVFASMELFWPGFSYSLQSGGKNYFLSYNLHVLVKNQERH